MAVYYGSLLWQFIMAVYYGSLLWQFIMAVYYGSLLWQLIMAAYCGMPRLTGGEAVPFRRLLAFESGVHPMKVSSAVITS
jgi:hypothetical protein